MILGMMILMAGCSSGKNVPFETQPVSFPIIQNTETPTSENTKTLTPTLTQVFTPTNTSTIDYSTLGSLRELALTIDDIPRDHNGKLAFFLDYLPYSTPVPNGPMVSITDATQGMIDEDKCYVDCARSIWQKWQYKLVSSLSRFNTPQDAESTISASRDAALQQQEARDNTFMLAKYCHNDLSENTWIIGRLGEITLMSSKGPIVLELQGNATGDDYVHYNCVLAEFAELQWRKIAESRFFP